MLRLHECTLVCLCTAVATKEEKYLCVTSGCSPARHRASSEVMLVQMGMRNQMPDIIFSGKEGKEEERRCTHNALMQTFACAHAVWSPREIFHGIVWCGPSLADMPLADKGAMRPTSQMMQFHPDVAWFESLMMELLPDYASCETLMMHLQPDDA